MTDPSADQAADVALVPTEDPVRGHDPVPADAPTTGRASAAPPPRPPRRRQKPVLAADVGGQGINARIARRVTAVIGTMYAFYAFALVMAGWILWQAFLSPEPFDPYPFAFLLFLGNLVQLLLMPLIMVGQNVQSAHADAREEADFDVDRRAEEEVEALTRRLGEIDRRTVEILTRLDALGGAGPSAAG